MINADEAENPDTRPAVEEAVEKARTKIEAENKQKQQDYDKKLEAGRTRVKELNDRFADWYYVISDDVYQKIRLNRDNIVKAKEPAASEEGDEGS